MISLHLSDILGITLIGGGIIVGLFAGITLISRKAGNLLSNRVMAALMFLVALTLFNQFLNFSGLCSQHPDLYFLPLQYTLSIGPLLYFYIRAKLIPIFRFQWINAVHFVLPIAQAVFYFSVGFRDLAYKGQIWRTIVAPWLQLTEDTLFLLGLAFYLHLATHLLKQHAQAAQLFWEKDTIRWLRKFIRVMTFLLLVSIGYQIADLISSILFETNLSSFHWVMFPKHMVNTLVCIWIAFNAYLQHHPELTLSQPAIPATSPTRSIDSGLRNKLFHLLEQEQVYLNPDFSLSLLAHMLDVNKNEASAAVNAEAPNFNQFVNAYRIRSFQEKATNPAYAHYNMLGLAYESGFNSKATFNRTFKEQTGKTPSQYLKEQGLKS